MKNLSSYIFIASLFVLANIVYGIDRLSEFGDILVNVKGQSGKIAVTKAANDKEAKSTATITMKSLYEKDKDGNIIGTSGNKKHSFNNFAQLEFAFSPLVNDTYQELACRYFNFTATNIVNEDTTLTAYVYIFQENGTITVGEDQEVNVTEGSMKFSVQVNNWPFCLPKNECEGTTCCTKGNTYEVGSYLDFTIEMKNNDASPNKRDKNSIPLGGKGQVILNSQVYADGSWISMPDGYPMQSDDDKSNLILRFAKFSKSALYDPVVDMSGEVTYRDTSETVVTDETKDDGNNSSYMRTSLYFIGLVLGVMLF